MPQKPISQMTDAAPALSADRIEISRETAPGVWQSYSVDVGDLGALINAAILAGASAGLDTFAEAETVLAGKVAKTGGALTGALEPAASVDVASAATADIGAVASNIVRITGSTTITNLGNIAAGALRFVTFAGALTLTHDATNLILPFGASIETAAGDSALFVSAGSGRWRCLFYQNGGWKAWTPTVAATTPAGSGFAATVSFARYEKRGRTVNLQFLISITNLGSGPAASGNITVTLPYNAANASVCTGGEYGVTSKGVQGSVIAGSNLLNLRLTDGTATAVTSYQFRVQMTYEATA